MLPGFDPFMLCRYKGDLLSMKSLLSALSPCGVLQSFVLERIQVRLLRELQRTSAVSTFFHCGTDKLPDLKLIFIIWLCREAA
jgi:hypothetical protein